MNKSFTTSVMLFFFITSQIYAQKTVTGVVIDSETKSPIPEVNVRLKGEKNILTKTNIAGTYRIKITDTSSKILVFSHKDYDEFEISTEGKNNIDVNLISNIRRNAYGKKVIRSELNAEMRNGTLVFEAKNKEFKYWFDNRIYFDGAYFFDKNTYNSIGSGVNIRKARFAFKSVLNKNWYGEIDLDFAYSKLELKDVYIKYFRNNWNIKAGNFKEAFSMENTTSSRYLTFMERSLVNELAPSRYLGFQANAYGKNWLFTGGIHFQDIGNDEVVKFSQSANKDEGTDEGNSLTGRAVFMPIQKQNTVLHLGAGISHRKSKTSDEIPDYYRASTRSLTSINRKKYLDTDDIENVESYNLYGFELAASWKNFMFQSEYIISELNRKTNYSDVKFNGFYAQAGVLLFGGLYVYNHKEGEFTQPDREKNWGEIELAIRYDYLNLNDFDAEIYGGAGEAITIGLNYYVNNNVKFVFNYSYLNHDRFANAKGKLNIYKDEAGNLYSDAFSVDIPKGKGGDNFGFLAARIEIDF